MPTSHAITPSETLADPVLEKRARDLSAELRCLVCQNQSIDDSDAPLAKDLRRLVRERLVKGDTDSEIRDYVVKRYGEFVLLRPRFGSHTLILWLAPFLFLLAGLLAAGTILRTRHGEPSPALSAKEKAELAKILSDGTGGVAADQSEARTPRTMTRDS